MYLSKRKRMNKLIYHQTYSDWEEFITDFIFDVMDSEGFSELEGYEFDYKTELGSKVWIRTLEGDVLCISYLHWDDDEFIHMEYEILRDTPIGLIKITKDS
jgi:hypothetical protein